MKETCLVYVQLVRCADGVNSLWLLSIDGGWSSRFCFHSFAQERTDESFHIVCHRYHDCGDTRVRPVRHCGCFGHYSRQCRRSYPGCNGNTCQYGYRHSSHDHCGCEWQLHLHTRKDRQIHGFGGNGWICQGDGKRGRGNRQFPSAGRFGTPLCSEDVFAHLSQQPAVFPWDTAGYF